ncbi:MAG TPA: alpha/beta hydrolase [Acidimicrobiales bacterium]
MTTSADSEDARVLRVASHGGVVLVGECRGDPSAPTVVFLHGGGQTRHSWGGTAMRVAARGWQTITLDARGHGESDWAPDANYQLSTFALDLACVVDCLDARPIVVGASLGGLTSILMAGELRPGSVAGLVLVDIIPGMDQGGADRIQSFMRERASTGFATLDEVADAVAAYNPHRPRPSDLSGLVKNLRKRDGRWYWHWDPAFIGGIADLGPREILDRDRLNAAMASIGVPAMLIRGRQSDLVSEPGAQAFLRQFPNVEFVDVSGAGHMVAGDLNDAFTEAVLVFLERHHVPR